MQPLIISMDSIILFFLATAVIGVAISYSKLYLFHISLIILIFLIWYRMPYLKLRFYRLPIKIHHIFYLMFGWYVLSILWSINRLYSLQYLFYIFCGTAIVLAIIYYARDRKKQAKVFRVLAFVFIVEVIISLLETAQVLRLPISPFSSYVSYFGREMTVDMDLDERILTGIFSAPTGFQWNPNNLAVTMIILLPFVLAHKSKVIKALGTLSIMRIIMMSGSRAALITFIFVFFLYFALKSKKSLIYSALMIPIFLLLLSVSQERLKESENSKIQKVAYAYEALKVYLFEEVTTPESIGIRQELVRNGLKAFAESGGLGVGGGGSSAVQEKAGGIAEDIISMHNFWVEMLVDSGFLFTAVFALWYIYMILKLYLIYVKTKVSDLKYYSFSSALSMTGFITAAVSASSVIYLLPMWLLYGFAIATINNYETLRSHETINARRS